MSRFEEAKEAYAAIGVDVEEALKKLQQVRISMHCWQGDDVLGFDSDALTGGIATTGNYWAAPAIQKSSWPTSARRIP